jgi:23S rRNA (pseudouridine1915-N3)-methyltransferase
MKLRILWIGKTRDAHLNSLINDYIARIRRLLPIEVIETKEVRADESKRLRAEGEKLLAAIDSTDRVVLLAPGGKTWTSPQFAQFVGKHMREDARRLTFVIGGFLGVSDEVTRRADVRWSLTPLTFTHDICRVLILEQIYRALTIIHGHPYSK